MDIHLLQASFKSVLNVTQNQINNKLSSSLIDCEDCRNQLLINESKDKQVQDAHCVKTTTKTLFDYDVKTKFKNKSK